MLNGFLQSAVDGGEARRRGLVLPGQEGGRAGPVTAIDGDKTPLPKCDPADKCGWECTVGKDKKDPTTVGEFVKWCIEPQLQ